MKYTLQVELVTGATSHQLAAILSQEARDWNMVHTDSDVPLVSESRFNIINITGLGRGYWSLED